MGIKEGVLVTGIPNPQTGVHGGQPLSGSGSPSTPEPGIIPDIQQKQIKGKKGAADGAVSGVGGVRKSRSGYREWKRGDPTLFNALWKSKTPLGIRKQLGKFKSYDVQKLSPHGPSTWEFYFPI